MVWLAVNSPLSDNKHLLITEEQVVGVEVRVGWGGVGGGFTWELFTPPAGLNAAAPFILGLLTQTLSCLITLIITFNLVVFFFFCRSPLPTAECKHPNPEYPQVQAAPAALEPIQEPHFSGFHFRASEMNRCCSNRARIILNTESSPQARSYLYPNSHMTQW